MVGYTEVFGSVPLSHIFSAILNLPFPFMWLSYWEFAQFLFYQLLHNSLSIFCGLAEDHNVRQQETVIWSVALWPGSGCPGGTLYPG